MFLSEKKQREILLDKPQEFQNLLAALKQQLAQLYGKQLKGIYLFGSYARGEQGNESDVDILIVLKRYERYGKEINRTGEIISNLSLQYGVTISRIFMREDEFQQNDSPLLRNVHEESIAI
jgi:predicted nucleotidyltransferase